LGADSSDQGPALIAFKGSSKLVADRAEGTPVQQTGGSSRSTSASGRSPSAFSRGLGPPPALVGAQLSSRSGTPASHPDRPFDELFAKLQDIEGKLREKDQADSKIKGLEIKVLPPTQLVMCMPCACLLSCACPALVGTQIVAGAYRLD
jgi:hypothetical protein